ncbi:branched-chain alpha-keto acid dehydrogenase subunit E2 [Hyphomicrobium nitrativorans NL23]|uniref:Dihydrolipoamide acetyltransferase component of pyruvate dehydrogenase complex n=1 Tax=Hyphomicrobium nitrativorans NL23 TaxID=1029756 RepID=V5SEP1_9HYPH|nr:2-oxo acid dehydrogenase subunit E2 [Hyphomicrobium nitrativorans]AHB49326.1 branched-chain alpha-keto acid dehydrogenase subunit E2 [Hyphomicrobium nitrativorans NL23]
MSAIEVKVPDIGDYKDVPVIEVHVKAGDAVRRDDPLITLESDKAAMEVPAPEDGEISEVLVKVGDKVSEGSPIVRLASQGASGDAGETAEAEKKTETETAEAKSSPSSVDSDGEATSPTSREPQGDVESGTRVPLPLGSDFGGVHASPSVRRLARELDIDLTKLKGTGEKGRITKDDVKRALGGAGGGGAGIPEIPPQDFTKYGPVENRPLSRLKRLGGPHLHRAWLNIPHVTHADQADITDLEAYRKSLDTAAKEKGYRVTLLAFIMKACVVALKEFPAFNASLAPDKETLILKHYYHLGIAVDTPDGLVVPVIRDVDRKGIVELSQEIGTMSERMRLGKIAPQDIQGGTFSISSLGGIGGTSFTPIINAPEVAILGVVRAEMTPKWDGEQFLPRLMLPLMLSYDHRVIDGAEAAQFTRRLAVILEDVRQLVL